MQRQNCSKNNLVNLSNRPGSVIKPDDAWDQNILKMRAKHILVIAAAALMCLTACGGGSDKDEVTPPGAVTLLSPAGNSVCIKGALTSETGKSKVSFSWKNAVDAEQYRIDITNLNSKVSLNQVVSGVSCDVTLNEAAYYSWCVTAINAGGSTSSDTLQFYLSGTPASNYAPFPADLTFPLPGTVINANGAATVQVAFQWTGNDLDNDIAHYAFYLDYNDASTAVVSSLVNTTSTQTLATGKTYYWKVVTTDAAGNSAASAVVSFKVE